MKLVYGKDKLFLGLVKFFDASKDFGHIASNNCGMASPKYYQDFYVDSSSFIDFKAKKEGIVVVFQVGKQDDGRKRAVNVRLISNSDEDIQLVLSYYGEYENVKYKDERIVNLYSQINKPRKAVADLVLSRIVNDRERTPETTCKHFKLFVDHYKEYNQFTDRYIFDRDFKRNERIVWEDFFKIFTKEECHAILNVYPSICQYISDTEIVKEWLITIFKDKYKADVFNRVDSLLKYGYISDSIKKEISELYDDYAISKKVCDYAEALEIYKGCPSNYFLNNLLQAYESLGRNKESYKKELIEANVLVIERLKAEKKYDDVIELYSKLLLIDNEFIREQLNIFFPQIKQHLYNLLFKLSYWNLNTFFSSYNRYTRLFTEEQKTEMQKEAMSIMIEAESLEFLSICSSSSYGWISVNDALCHVEKIISKWNHEKLCNSLFNESQLFNNDLRFYDIVFSRSFEIAKDLKLPQSKNEQQTIEYDGDIIFPCIENDCYIFLNGLKRYIISDTAKRLWSEYINSHDNEELILLYKHKVINNVPTSVYKYIIDSITLDWVYEDFTHWYNKPSLKDYDYIKVLKESDCDILSFVTERLLSLDLSTTQNIPLAVLLLQLLELKKPEEKDTTKLQNWEKRFEISLKELRNVIGQNDKLAVILWAVYLKTSGPIKTLSEVFVYLPPYLQIKCVKKLFAGVAMNKISYTAESLYDLLNPNKQNICLPLEITFEYLKLRERYSFENLCVYKILNVLNNMLLRTLANREEHNEWVGIRDFFAICSGRWILKSDSIYKSYDNLYNGTIEVEDSKIIVMISKRMIDSYGNLQHYNNKYYEQLEELIRISFKNTEYQIEYKQDKIVFYFDRYKNEIELASLARYYKLDYKNIIPSLDFIRHQEDDNIFCECRLTNKLDDDGLAFYWCNNKKCYRTPLRYRTSFEWEHYTVLDFMRILNIPTDYINKNGELIKYGYYILLSSSLRSFYKFYEHLKCRECGQLLKPIEEISNFDSRVINTFECVNEQCSKHIDNEKVYLNHCFNKLKCKEIIDSRDSKKCPNGQYICPKCGACCSTENFKIRLDNLRLNGGKIYPGLVSFVNNKMGHWEKNEFFCFKCGEPMIKQNDGTYKCETCSVNYNHK